TVILRDVTESRRRTDAEMESRTAQVVAMLAGSVAHEIGNPLNALALNLQLIKRMPSDAVEIADACAAQVKRLDGILKNFLQALRQSRPNLMPGSVAEPLKDCLQAMKPQLVERKIAVTLDVPGTLPSAAIDKGQLEQVFFNLVKNAMEAIRDGGTIDIDLDADDNDIIVVFRDNGIGMSEEQVIHLFEPYKTNKAFGTGLGLMISARIVRDHGGSISVESKPGEGTTFILKLPRLERRIRVLK
ncbi:MAG: PAS domain-containing sensor histidine kinase, partial [Kiritimatiellae bacterium]|nr:PAS domain-containing sensor histidine kinase [Kiritimatiellia bacterium]